MGAAALTLAELAPGGTGNLRCAPRPSPRKDKSTALRATHSPTTARKRSPQGKGGQGGVKGARRGGPE